jgi:predicted enzyme related to lactoylglutathione lyase
VGRAGRAGRRGQAGQAVSRAGRGVADVQAALDHFLAAGAGKLKEIQDVGGGIKLVLVLDPFGNRLGLIENPHFGK